MKVEGYTARQMAEMLKISYIAVRQRIFVAKIEPITKEAIYPLEALEKIRNVPGRGRPSKTAETAEKTEEARKLYLEAKVAQIAFVAAINGGNFEEIYEKERMFSTAFIKAHKLRKYLTSGEVDALIDFPPMPEGFRKWERKKFEERLASKRDRPPKPKPNK